MEINDIKSFNDWFDANEKCNCKLKDKKENKEQEQEQEQNQEENNEDNILEEKTKNFKDFLKKKKSSCSCNNDNKEKKEKEVKENIFNNDITLTFEQFLGN
jgi:phage-related minor tail protein